MKLAELQRFFARAVTTGEGPIEGLEQVFLGSQRLPARARIAIYNRGYHYRRLDALGGVFSATRRRLGDDEFEQVGLRYLAEHPSDHPAVERSGQHFADFLSEYEPSLRDLAALEWARLCCLVAADPAQLAVAQDIDPSVFPDCQLHFVPALRLLELDPTALDAFTAPAPASTTAPAAEPPSAFERPHVGVAVYRQEYAVRHQVLPPLDFRALLAARSGERMRTVCALFDTGHDAADAERAFRVVATWFARGWVECCSFLALNPPPASAAL